MEPKVRQKRKDRDIRRPGRIAVSGSYEPQTALGAS